MLEKWSKEMQGILWSCSLEGEYWIETPATQVQILAVPIDVYLNIH